MTAKKTRNIVLALVAAIVLVLVAVFAGVAAQESRLSDANSPMPTKAPAAGESAAAEEFSLARRKAEDPLAMGDVDAPVVMVEYSDYRCPFCGVYARKTQPEIIKKYVETGKLRIEWRDLPVTGEESVPAAVAGRAAAEQGMFWEFNEAVYAAAPEKGKADLNESELLALAKTAGIPDMTRFAADMKNPDLLAAVQADLSEGSALGVNSTPSFVIGKSLIPGAQPIEVFSKVIDEALAQVK